MFKQQVMMGPSRAYSCMSALIRVYLCNNQCVSCQKIIDNCLHVCLQLTANLAVFINPFLPFAAKKMCYMMKVVDKMLDWENGGKGKITECRLFIKGTSVIIQEDRRQGSCGAGAEIKNKKFKINNERRSPTAP